MASEFEDVAKVSIQFCDRLEEIASQAWSEMTDLDELTGTLAEDLETAIGDATGRMRALVSATPGARNRIEGGATSVQAAFERLLKAVGSAVREHEEDAGRVVAAAGQLEALPAKPAGVLAEVLPLIDKGVAGVDAAVERFSELLTREGDAALAGLNAAASDLDAGLANLDSGQKEWAERLDALTNGAGDKVGSLLGTLALAAAAHARGTVDTLNGAVAPHNAFSEQLSTVLGPDLATALQPALAELGDGQDVLHDATEAHSAEVLATVAAIRDTATELAGELDDVGQGLNVLAGIGG